MPVIICLIELGIDHSESLHEAQGREGLTFELKVREKLFSSCCHQLGWITSTHATETSLVCLEGVFQLINPFQALNGRIHVACVPEVLETGGQRLPRLLMQDAGFLLGRHVLDELNLGSWLLQLPACRRPHHEELGAIRETQGCQVCVVLRTNVYVNQSCECLP